VKRGPTLVVLGLLALAIALPVTGGELGFGAKPSPSAGGALIAATPSPVSTPAASAAALPSTGSAPSATPVAADPTEVPAAALADVPIVPVAQFRATVASTSKKEVAAVLAGTSDRYEALELVKAEADAILAALGMERPAVAARLVEAKDAAALTAHLAKHRKRLAFLRADAVGPGVRALTWGGKSLFGVDRVTDTADWTLRAELPDAPAGAAFDAAETWTMFAGGDIMLDRGVYDMLRNKGKGADFPYDGGTADITSLVCCSSFGWKVPRLARTGHAGTFRDLISSADIALANFENPAPNKFTWHTSKTIFSADQTLVDGIVKAGFDVMGVANNHIGDQGATGLTQTVKNLRKRGLLTAGAGKDLAAARKPAMIQTHGVDVAILAYDAIAPSYHATDTKVGSAPMKLKVVKADIKAARAAGADVVVVFPHWGTEYRATVGAAQQKLARAVIDAGADMIIGNHAHWTVEMEVYKGKPIWYALGNLVFDQTWSAETMEGMTLELTFRGDDLAQIRMRPHVILDKAQPNFLDATDGKAVMGRVYGADLPW
jgi:poly-gamma-glutamate synthesis protein (capsule biosynthesis protein)